MGPRLDLLGSVGRYMRIVKIGELLGLPFGKASGQDFDATTGIPINGTIGWAPAALFHNTKNGIVYRNSGTITSSLWVPLASAPAASPASAFGTAVLDGTNPTPIVTGLTTITAAVVTLRGAVAPGLATSVLTTATTAGTLNVYGWKPTDATNPTLIASTGTDAFDWAAWGT